MRVLGAVLAGGQSRRFGSDKALAMLGGKPLIEHAIAALSAQTDAVIVCGREWTDWVADRPAPGLGPLGGINAALHCALERGFDAVLTLPCDTPLLPPDIRRHLAAAGPAAFLENMPVIGLWPAALAPALDAHLARSVDRSVRGWAGQVEAVPSRLDKSIPNVNSLSDLNLISGHFP
jgi:molybdopterin-guanine dinucleotide biosynthesis protein A